MQISEGGKEDRRIERAKLDRYGRKREKGHGLLGWSSYLGVKTLGL